MTASTKLLIVRPTLGTGGADRVTLTLLKHLPRDRFGVRLALMRSEGPWRAHVPDDVDVTDLRAAGLSTSVGPVARLVARAKPDVILVTCGGMSIPVTLAWLALGKPCRLVLSERNALFHGGKTAKRLALTAWKRALFPLADCVTAVSEGVAREVERDLRVPASRVLVTHNPVVDDDVRAQARAPLAHPFFSDREPARPVVLAAGRFVHEKGFDVLLDAFARMRSRSSTSARLVILGDGPLRASLAARARRLGLADDDVAMPGFDPNPFKYMARASAFVLSSRNEGLPGTLIQAMACGAPAISTDCPFGPSEVIDRPGENGVLVPVDDVDALARAMERILADRAFAQRVAAGGRAAVERFAVTRSMARYIEAITGVHAMADAHQRAEHEEMRASA